MQNKVFLIGRVGKVAEMSKGNVPVLRLSLATGKKVKGEDVTQWHNIVCFDKLAKFMDEYCQKGALILVEGEINYSKFTAKDGTEKNKTEIFSHNIQILKWPADKVQHPTEETAINIPPTAARQEPPVNPYKYTRKSLKESAEGLYDPLPDDEMPF